MGEADHTRDQFYILATEARDERTRVLKHNDTFAVFDRAGEIRTRLGGEQGLYHEGTRFLSRSEIRVGGIRLLLLSSTVQDSNDLFTADLTNPDLIADGVVVLPKGSLHVLRSRFLWNGSSYERLRVTNYGLTPARSQLEVFVGADFADIFEVRGARRKERGRQVAEVAADDVIRMRYQGLDNVQRTSTLEFDPTPRALGTSAVEWELSLEPGEQITFCVVTRCRTSSSEENEKLSCGQAFFAAKAARDSSRELETRVTTSSERFNRWLSRSLADVQMMITATEAGSYPFAGVPWFSTPFGRDGLVTALETLWLDPTIARGVLTFLASTQAREINEERDAQPGKILHEMRKGEMAATGEVPFGWYYGSVDATPLFVFTAGEYLARTGDLALIEELWPSLESALAWMERDGDIDHDGFVEYYRMTPRGLVQQGWKDSYDAIFDEHGTLAEGPIALCEVQAYAYGAWRSAARLAKARGDDARAKELLARATRLKEQFEVTFWDEELGTYVLALDGQKRPLRVRSSNAGHALFAGIVSDTRAQRVAETLLSPDGFSGWGVRTISERERRYNPMSYHNGSVWPHDNALIAAGFARYGLKAEAARILSAMFNVSEQVDLYRLPELFCGFVRRPGEGPTLYPTACAPQAWAAAAVFFMLQSALGMTIDASERRIAFSAPQMPEALSTLRIDNLRVGESRVSLLCERHPHDVGITVLERDGDPTVVTIK